MSSDRVSGAEVEVALLREEIRGLRSDLRLNTDEMRRIREHLDEAMFTLRSLAGEGGLEGLAGRVSDEALFGRALGALAKNVVREWRGAKKPKGRS